VIAFDSYSFVFKYFVSNAITLGSDFAALCLACSISNRLNQFIINRL